MQNKLKKKFEDLMKNADPNSGGSFRKVLDVSALLYGAGLSVRNTLYHRNIKSIHKLPCFVLSVGNLALGGAGKTPMVIYLAHFLTKKGFRVAIVSRGYGGSQSNQGGIVSDGKKMCLDVTAAGDEPYMAGQRLLLLGADVPVVIGANRYKAGLIAVERFSPNIIILDDAYQHRSLFRNLNLLLCDAARPFGSGRLIPSGTLREPVSAVSRADMVVLTRSNVPEEDRSRFLKWNKEFSKKELPVFTCDHCPVPLVKEAQKGDCLFAVSGISNNQAFRDTVIQQGYVLADYTEFLDHHFYTLSEVKKILESAKKSEAKAIVTTEKDAVKLAPFFDKGDIPLWVLGIDIDFGPDRSNFETTVLNSIADWQDC